MFDRSLENIEPNSSSRMFDKSRSDLESLYTNALDSEFQNIFSWRV